MLACFRNDETTRSNSSTTHLPNLPTALVRMPSGEMVSIAHRFNSHHGVDLP